MKLKTFVLIFFGIVFLTTCSESVIVEFPSTQPKDGNFNRPLPGEVLDISPPGFCWWRAAPRGEVSYRLRIEDGAGEQVYMSGLLGDPVHVPNMVIPAGSYLWFVDALDASDNVVSTRPAQRFVIKDNSLELPWIEPAELLSRIPAEHPRLLFPENKMLEIRKSLEGSRLKAYEGLKKVADEALNLEIMVKPDFDKFDWDTEYAARRTAYRAAYHEFERIYIRGMVPLAMMYQLSGDDKYGLAAKKHLLNVVDWELDDEGVASIVESFDEIGLKIARTAAQGYDWLYDLLSEEEKEAVKQMLIARGDQMLARMERRDFLNYSAYSHDGRLPGYLVEFSLVLAEEERAKVWLDYAMRALMTVFPHWGGKDGGWAEGVNYVLSYNIRFITPLQSLLEATGFDLWKKSYFRKMRHFVMYCTSPMGEVTPFGDSEHYPVEIRANDIYSILLFHALRYEDPETRWWIEQLDRDKENPADFRSMYQILLGDVIEPVRPDSIVQDRAFFGIGWAAMHSDILHPDNDLMILFKCSPYGPVSHSHADQNSFAILKGGNALAHPSGARYPQHQSPFHFEYTNLTVAHNALLINGEGQIDRDANANGSLVDFKSTEHIGYVSGDAQKCYGNRLDHYLRHLVFIRPSVILVIDDLSGSEPFSVDWLIHGKEEILLNPEDQIIESTRLREGMLTYLITPGKFDFSLTNEWPFNPKKNYEMVTAEPPAKEWHFSAATREKTDQRRIVAVMMVKENGDLPVCDVEVEDDLVYLNGKFEDDTWSGIIHLGTSNTGAPILKLEYQPASGTKEILRIPS